VWQAGRWKCKCGLSPRASSMSLRMFTFIFLSLHTISPCVHSMNFEVLFFVDRAIQLVGISVCVRMT
jgi:hypothetical protein